MHGTHSISVIYFFKISGNLEHISKVRLKILQARLQQYVNHELPDVQDGFRKGRGTGDQMPTSAGSSKKHESSRKTSISALLTMPKSLTMKKAIEIIHKLFRDSLVVKTPRFHC